ncbi:hypothetical protein OPV22_016107 [Ensete ventricosum]|uniref:Uncharacterized protein n=1 Tax=Ensete ventricosum TaxID=4639 RepID=A0AAV8QV14_ENSVE|nr:hypothetical protein OPV22_016107 [Ensete ventricosum]
MLRGFTGLKLLEFYSCKNLRSLPPELDALRSLQVLHVYYCPQIQSLPEMGLPASLKNLHFDCCHPMLTEQLEKHLVKMKISGRFNGDYKTGKGDEMEISIPSTTNLDPIEGLANPIRGSTESDSVWGLGFNYEDVTGIRGIGDADILGEQFGILSGSASFSVRLHRCRRKPFRRGMEMQLQKSDFS